MILSVFDLERRARRASSIIVGLLGTLAVTIPLFALINGTHRARSRTSRSGTRHGSHRSSRRSACRSSSRTSRSAIYGVDYESVPNFIPRTDAITIGDVAIQWNTIAVFLIVIPVLARAHVVRAVDAPGEGDARRRPRTPEAVGDDGHRRQPDDLGDVLPRRWPRRGRRARLPARSSTSATTRASSSG